MESRDLRYFIALAEELHFGRAARRLAITQPPLSYAIQKLESHLNVKLLIRDSRNVRLTREGRTLYQEAKHIVKLMEEVERKIGRKSLEIPGQISIAYSIALINVARPAVTEFNCRFPNVEIILEDMIMAEQVEALKKGTINLALAVCPGIPDGLDGFVISRSSFVCCVPAGSPLAQESRIALQDLANYPFISFSKDITSFGSKMLERMCIAAGFYPRVRVYAKQWLTSVAMVASGFGIAIVPKVYASTPFPKIKYIELDNVTEIFEGYCLWNPALHADHSLEFARTLKRQVKLNTP